MKVSPVGEPLGTPQNAIATNTPFPLQSTGSPMTQPPVEPAATLPTANGNLGMPYGKKSGTILETESVSVTSGRTAMSEEPGAQKSNYLHNYKTVTVDIGAECVEEGKPYKFITWLPNRASNAHSRTTTYSTTIPADDKEGDVIKLENEVSQQDQDELKKVIDGFVKVQVANFGFSEDVVQEMMAEGKMWGFTPCGTPTIEDITWLKAANKNVYHAVGINFEELEEEESKKNPLKKSATKLTHIAYQSPFEKTKKKQNFQIIVEPNVTNVVHSDSFKHMGKLLQCNNRDEDDPFIVNGQCAELQSSSYAYSKTLVEIKDLDILWGLANMAYIWPMYASKHTAETLSILKAESGQELTLTEWKKSMLNKENNAKISSMLMEVENNPKLHLGEKISANLSILALNFAIGHGNKSNFFKITFTENGPRYRLPGSLRDMIHTEYNTVLDKQGVFNNAKNMRITATSLKATKRNVSIDTEEANSVMVIFNVTGYYSTQGWVILPLQ